MEPSLRIWAVLKCDLGNWVLIIFEFLRFRMVGRVDMEVLVGEVKVVVVMVVLAAVTVVVEISLCYHAAIINMKFSYYRYLALLAKYPVTIKALTSAPLTLIGDLICQLVIDQVPSLDVKRTFLFTLLGLVLVGPTLHFWYLYLSKLVPLPGASGAFLRLLLDQFLFSPIFIGVFLATLVTLEGRPSQVIPKLQQEWFSAVLANWKLWIPFQFLNFRFVPQQFQVLAANFIALIWNVFLSFIAHKEILQK